MGLIRGILDILMGTQDDQSQEIADTKEARELRQLAYAEGKLLENSHWPCLLGS